MKTILISFLMLTVFLSVNGQTSLNPLESTPYIEVTGEGEMEIIPDEIFISFTLKERYDGKTKIAIDTQEKELKQKLLKLNFDLKNLTLADKASYLLEAVGEQVGKPLYIQERETYQPEMRMMGAANMVFKMEDSVSEEPLPEISFKKITLKYTVFARFAIK